jgi:hypothetical protein
MNQKYLTAHEITLDEILRDAPRTQDLGQVPETRVPYGWSYLDLELEAVNSFDLELAA